ncbi:MULTISPECIES: type VI secretion protein IcmF/TssM N-terminal domain-containing protein [unclassified Caballeronia]|jgi:type VI secretion system protein ImpL|uniref:type VI secretion protein IcmF/TssM N-terminal domain-containing protein n=1 Tax=unclassified Caballeronia TaxID=2646786 RepID=UPI0020298D0C|nr:MULTISPECIES: type VI secretion protein IcmF/TssM N-terminal domain-containing protein [unclassified Caballeronia]
MKTLGIVLLWLLTLIVVAAISWGVVLYFGWPLWIALAIFAGVFALYFFAIFARRMFVMMRSRSRLAAQSRALHAEPVAVSPEAMLKRKWKAAIGTLRQSNLRTKGDPLYALPWFMVVGQSGTGKTTALTRARLSSPIQKISQQASIGQTVNCDWWYFDRAVVIDCAGRYVQAEDIEQDRREWEVGLDLLGRYRPREGLDGLVLAVSAERLMSPHADTFADEGRIVRARIEQLIRMFGKRFPVYVLVTKCDRLYGFEEWAKSLPADALDQAMGYLADESESADSGERAFVGRAFDSIGARLQALRLAMLSRDTQPSPELLMFPNELAQLRGGLTMFLGTCLADSPYLERPLLRGIFFSSGQQEGGAMSALMGSLLSASPPHASDTAGVFLHDFFGRILPQDRLAAKPAMLVNHWRRVTQSVGVVAWILLLAVFAILLSVSFAGNKQTLELVRSARPDKAALNGNLFHDANALSYSNEVLMQVAQNDRRWMSGLLGNGAGLEALEARLHDVFVQQYRQAIQPAADQSQQTALAASAGLASAFGQAGQSGQPAEEARQLLNLARSIALLRARMGGADRETLEAMPQPVATSLFPAQLNAQLNPLAISYLVWSPKDAGYLQMRAKSQRALLDQAVAADPQMTWLVGLVPDGGEVPAARAADFWGGNAQPLTILSDAGLRTARGSVVGANVANTADASVPAVYTVAGKQALDSLAAQIRASVSDTAQFDRQRAAFEDWYRTQRIAAWQSFVDDFTKGPAPYAGEAGWRSALGIVSGPASPYFRLIARIDEEFAREPADAPMPGWITLARQFEQVRAQATRAGAANQAVRVAGAINAVGGAALKDVLSGSPQLGSRTVTNNLGAVDALTQYLGALNKLALDSSAGSGKDYQIAADYQQYSTSAQPQPSEMMNALQPLAQLRTLLGTGEPSDALTWRLIRGPFEFLSAYIEQQASCELQRGWESSVVFPLQGATDKSAAIDQLFGAKGAVWAFADGPAKPFLTRNANRYDVIETQGFRVPFTSAFVPTLNGAYGRQLAQQQASARSAADKQAQQLEAQKAQLEAQQQLDQLDRALAAAKTQADAARAVTVPLTLTAQPTNVNAGAQAKPYATILTVQCATGVQTLNNYNFPVSTSFAWQAGQCGDVRLQIKIGNLTLNRNYAGPLGVASFLKDFADGQRQFVPADFPASETALRTLDVTSLTVMFSVTNGEQVTDAAQKIQQYDALQKTTAQQKQQIQDAQAQRQQMSLADQLAVMSPGMPPLPAIVPTVAGNPVSLGELGVPATIGACWRGQTSAMMMTGL